MSDIDAVALGRWLADNVDGISSPDVTNVEIISGGASNLTIGVDIDGRQLVVRRPPVGAFLPSANDVSREYRYLAALQETDVPTPPVHAFCDDAEVIGAPFYVMERLHGIVPHEPEALAGITAEEGRALSQRFVGVLQAIHGVDIDAVGLGDAAKRTGFLERQVSRWTDQWHRAKESDSPVIDELAVQLERRLPTSPPTTVVHGDYRLCNLMLERERPERVEDVLDWEMGAIGEPRADLGYLLATYAEPGGPPSPLGITPVTAQDGFPTKTELVARYTERSGRSVGPLGWFEALALWKAAVFCEAIYGRYRRGELGAEDAGAAAFETAVPLMAETAVAALDRNEA